MKVLEKIITKRMHWVSAIMLIFILALTAGCTNPAESGQASNPTDDSEYVYRGAEAEADTDYTGTDYTDDDFDFDDLFCCHDSFEDFEMIVATVNGRDIVAGAVMNEFSWALNVLMMDYVMMFPEDTDWNFDHIFRDDVTFGRVVREEAVRMAAHIQLYMAYAERHDIFWEEWSNIHPVIQIVYEIVENPDMFAEFEPYMPEDTFEEHLQKAEELLARALSGEDFAMLVATYGEDPGMETFPEGYTFVRGDMVPEFELATLELEIGEISGLVISSFGIHIIKRVEPDPENIMPGSRAEPNVADEDLLGAMHILVMATELSLEDRMAEAVFGAFEAKLEMADIVFLASLDEVPLT